MKLRNVILVSYLFPPMGGSGVQRAQKLARYWPELGWRPHIICAGHSSIPLRDDSLLDEIPPACTIHRTLGFEPAALATRLSNVLPPAHASDLEPRLAWRFERVIRYLPLPETELLWVPSAIAQARRIIEQNDVRAIVTTSPPLSSHLIGLHLKRRLGIPWIADLRDPILDNFTFDRSKRIHSRFATWIERQVVEQSDAVVVTCPELSDRLQSRYPAVPAHCFTAITNGYDPADRPQPQRRPDKRFVIAYVGAFYRAQSIGPLLDAIRALRAAHPAIRENLEFRMVGTIADSQRKLITHEDQTFFRQLGYLDHAAALQELADADCLLLMTPSNDGGRFCIPAKTFEYLAFGKRIVAFAHPGTRMAELMNASTGCTLLANSTAEAWADGLLAGYQQWQGNPGESFNREHRLTEFRRDTISRRYAAILDDCDHAPKSLTLKTNSLSNEAAA